MWFVKMIKFSKKIIIKSIYIFLLIYLSYRYPLKLNFSGTSPTYEDTPLLFQLIKYGVASIGAALIILFKWRWHSNSTQNIFFIGLFLLCFIGAAKGLIKTDSRYLEPFVWPIISYFYAIEFRNIREREIGQTIICLYLYAVIFEAVQLYLFFSAGRLPALAYENSFSVRFGSFLDDPNGFAAICFLFYGYFDKKIGYFKFWNILITVIMILLTQSLTAIVFLVILLTMKLIIFVYKNTNRRIIILRIIFLISMIIFCIQYDVVLEILKSIFSDKQSSIEQHADSAAILSEFKDLKDLLIGYDRYYFVETGYVLILINFGILVGSFWFFMHISILLFVARKLRILKSVASLKYTSVFLIYYIVANLNFPMSNIFPLNLIFFTISFMAIGDACLRGRNA
jgi:hypothetical protein